ncbi:hypothetical protein FRC11_009919, partial [Ceratobasidium sp. 423]
MSRKLHSDPNYNASKAPVAPKRHTKKCKVPEESAREEPRQTNKDKGEQAIIPGKRGRLTFGTVAGDTNGPGKHAVVVGTGKRRGIALTGDDGVMLSPSAYLALMHRVPPIRRSFEATECAPVELAAAPGSAECAPAAIEAPTTPTATMDSLGAESDDDVYVTARTSRVRDRSMALDENGNPVLAQYVVNDHVSETPTASSKRKRTRRKSKGKRKAKWPDVRRVNGEDTHAEPYGDLPDVSGWVNPNWSRSDYIPMNTEHSTETDRESVEVNAVIYKVDENYMFNDEEYAAVLQDLCEQDRSESTHSQTGGAGPSRSHKLHHVTIEEVEDGSDATATSRTQSYVGKGKGRAKSKKKSKKRKGPSLGAALDDLEGPREHSTFPIEPLNASVTYRRGGYLEGVVGSTPAPGERGRDRLRAKRAKGERSLSSGSHRSWRCEPTPKGLLKGRQALFWAVPSHLRVNANKVRPEEKIRISSLMLKELGLTRLRDKIMANGACVETEEEGETGKGRR